VVKCRVSVYALHDVLVTCSMIFPSLISRYGVDCDVSLADTGSQVMPVCGVLLYSDVGCQKFPT